MKIHTAILVLLISCLTGCGKQQQQQKQQQAQWKEGGLFAIPNEQGSFSVLKILKMDEGGVHVRLYSNTFEAPPSDVDETTLYMAGEDRKEDEPLAMGHFPVSKESFASWNAVYVKTVSVTEDELEGYRMWLGTDKEYF